MHPMQFSSFATYIGDQPMRLACLRHAKTWTGQTARQKPHALHMSSVTITSHLPAGPFDGFFSTLNSGMRLSPGHRLQGDLLRVDDVLASQPLGGLGVARGDVGQDLAVLRVRVAQAVLLREQPGMEPAYREAHHRRQAAEARVATDPEDLIVERDVRGKPLVGVRTLDAFAHPRE